MSSYLLNEDICPLLTADILNKLSESKVNSVIDLLSCDLSKIRRISRNKEIDFKILLEIKNQLYRRFSAKKFIASELIPKLGGFKTGIAKLDEMLVNGIRRGELTELYGYPSSGKTQFCYTFAANLVNKYKKKVLFIDTELSFSLPRLKEIVKMGSALTEEKATNLMSNVKVITIFKISSLLNQIETISHDLTTNSQSEYKDLDVIIIDCLSTLFTTEMKKKTFKAQEEKERNNSSKASDLEYRFIALITETAKALNSLASDHSMAVIVVNTQSLSLKNNWKNYCKLCLNFFERNKSEENDGRNRGYDPYKGITITRSYDQSIANKSYDKFMITARGFIEEDPHLFVNHF